MFNFEEEPLKKDVFKIIIILVLLVIGLGFLSPLKYKIVSPISSEKKQSYEVFGFAPYWNLTKLDNIDFNVLTTLAYFDIPVDAQGQFDDTSPGFNSFLQDQTTELFKKAHSYGTRVVVTLTQMNNPDIESVLLDSTAQSRLVKNTVDLVKKRGLDGVNIDFEYVGYPGPEYQKLFSKFIKNLTRKMHKEIPGSKVTVSVYASSAKHKKLYDIKELARVSDGIFIMAYDFANASSENAIPTSPLYGYKQGKYWYDVSTAVDDFLRVAPPEKLILGLPWYGYNYPVAKPEVKAATYGGYYTYYWYRGRRYWNWVQPPVVAQTYAVAQNEIEAESTGWDNDGKVGWKAYVENGTWRIIFIEDKKSLKIKYDFAKGKNLAGVGIWALGNDAGRAELWNLLNEEFGIKLADSRILRKDIKELFPVL